MKKNVEDFINIDRKLETKNDENIHIQLNIDRDNCSDKRK